MANGPILTGQAGKAEAAIKTRKSRLDKMEEEATKASPDFDGSNLMRPDGTFADESFLSPNRRGESSGY